MKNNLFLTLTLLPLPDMTHMDTPKSESNPILPFAYNATSDGESLSEL